VDKENDLLSFIHSDLMAYIFSCFIFQSLMIRTKGLKLPRLGALLSLLDNVVDKTGVSLCDDLSIERTLVIENVKTKGIKRKLSLVVIIRQTPICRSLFTIHLP
jgi:hypothetical protein